MSQDINVLMGKIYTKEDNELEPENTIFDKFVFPLKTETDIQELNEHLECREHANQFVKELIKIGGMSPKSMTRRILAKLFSDDIAQMYSWIGFKGKKNFSLLCVTSTILKIEKVIKLWLVKAKERLMKKQKKDT